MKIAVLSGKGGAGKTFISVNLAYSAEEAIYIDCDTEEPDGRLFFKPENNEEFPVSVPIPFFSSAKCTGCRKCVEFCRFNALAYLSKKPMLFTEICHSCGGCVIVCPENAVSEIEHPVGIVSVGISGKIKVVTGMMNIGEASAVPVIKAALKKGFQSGGDMIIDCPPGSGCSVMESIKDADFCLIAAEATAFGFHNFKMIYELTVKLNKRCGVVINKAEAPYAPLKEFCDRFDIPVMLSIPYSEEIAGITAEGKILSDRSGEAKKMFCDLFSSIKKAAAEETVRI